MYHPKLCHRQLGMGVLNFVRLVEKEKERVWGKPPRLYMPNKKTYQGRSSSEMFSKWLPIILEQRDACMAALAIDHDTFCVMPL